MSARKAKKPKADWSWVTPDMEYTKRIHNMLVGADRR